MQAGVGSVYSMLHSRGRVSSINVSRVCTKSLADLRPGMMKRKLCFSLRDGYSSGVTAGGNFGLTAAKPGNLSEPFANDCAFIHSWVRSKDISPCTTMFGASTATAADDIPAIEAGVRVLLHSSPRVL